jgi:hypothetical protein
MLKHGSSAVGGSATASAKGVTTLAQTINGALVLFTAQPGQYGTYTYTVTLEDGHHQNQPIQGASVDLDLTMTSMVMSPVHVHLDPIQQGIPGSYQAQYVVSMLGAWKAVAHIMVPGSPPFTATFNFTAQF